MIQSALPQTIAPTVSADVRARLTHALRLDLVGPEPDDPQVSEVLAVPPSRWYLTGFLVPWNAPAKQKKDEDDTQGELGFAEPASGADDDDTGGEPPAAHRGHFPSSIGVSVLLPADASELRVSARWGDYEPREVGSKPDVEWQRHERLETVAVPLPQHAAMIDRAAEVVETRLAGQSIAQLVWTGPQSTGTHSRDTSVVVNELVAAAERWVLVSTFDDHNPRERRAWVPVVASANRDERVRVGSAQGRPQPEEARRLVRRGPDGVLRPRGPDFR